MTLREAVERGILNVYQAYLSAENERERLEKMLEKQAKELQWYYSKSNT